MHEVGLMAEAVRVAVEEARARGAQRVTVLRLRVGALSGVVPEALTFAFDLVTAGTPAAGARLEVEQVPAVWCCTRCGAKHSGVELWPECPACGSLEAELCQGRELEIVSIEVN